MLAAPTRTGSHDVSHKNPLYLLYEIFIFPYRLFTAILMTVMDFICCCGLCCPYDPYLIQAPGLDTHDAIMIPKNVKAYVKGIIFCQAAGNVDAGAYTVHYTYQQWSDLQQEGQYILKDHGDHLTLYLGGIDSCKAEGPDVHPYIGSIDLEAGLSGNAPTVEAIRGARLLIQKLAQRNGPPAVHELSRLVDDYPGCLQVREPLCDLGTPLHFACSTSTLADLPCVQFLADKCPQILGTKDGSDLLPLHRACGHHEAIRNDCSGTAYEILERIYSSPDGINLQVIQCLASAYPKALQTPDGEGRLPLHRACYVRAPVTVIEFLISCYPDATRVQDKIGFTPLHHAALKRNFWTSGQQTSHTIPTMRALLRIHPEILNAQDQDGDIPLKIAEDFFGTDSSVTTYLAQRQTEFKQGKALDLGKAKDEETETTEALYCEGETWEA